MTAIEVKVGTLPGVLKTAVVESGTTIRELLEMDDINLNSDGYEIRMNSCVVEDTAEVAAGTILLVKKIKGNR